jgi:hypothetical protein
VSAPAIIQEMRPNEIEISLHCAECPYWFDQEAVGVPTGVTY